MVLLLIFAFIAGVVTVLSPCILPVLPIVLSGAVGGKSKPFGVVTGFVLSFTFFTLFLSSIVQATGISATALRLFSVVVVISFGLSLIIPKTQVWLEKLFSTFAKFTPKKQRSGFVGGLLVGLSLGLIWTPCVGPILASVISLAITGSVTGAAALITLAYSLGTAIPMLGIAIGGNQALQKVPWLVQNTAKIQKGFGVIMVLTGLAIFFNLDRQFQTFILDTFPQYGAGLTSLEDNQLVEEQLNQLRGESDFDPEASNESFNRAPEIIPGGEWFNSEPTSLAELSGQVVLIDFWTYSCINCIRTLPYLRNWHEKYAAEGLVILGVHSPEFEFEKSAANLAEAIDDLDLKYPIFQDNNFETWEAYNNRYWPAKYLVDRNGTIRYRHFGEGKYEETENMIRQLLGEGPMTEFEEPSGVTQITDRERTHEIYLGYGRAKAYHLNQPIRRNQTVNYSFNDTLGEDQVGLEGLWTIEDEYIQAQADGAMLTLNFIAQQVYLVIEPLAKADANPATQSSIQVLLNGQPITTDYLTEDMDATGRLIIDSARKYDIIDLGDDYGRNQVTLVFEEGVKAFAFTFGS